MITHKEIGTVKVEWKKGSHSYGSKLACGKIADAGTRVILSKNPTCKECREAL